MASPAEPWTALPFLPEKRTLPNLESASKRCRGCPLYKNATQTVFGEGPTTARLMLIGEQPGDQEDVAGRPFVGPAGRVLDEALEAAGVSRELVYLTNAVKHFKWEQAGTRRLHAKPNRKEILACQPWLMAEIASVAPDTIVCLGATAAQSLLGSSFRLTKHRGELVHAPDVAPPILATLHPSAVLRMRTSEEREAAREALADDLRMAWQTVKAAA